MSAVPPPEPEPIADGELIHAVLVLAVVLALLVLGLRGG